MKKIYTVTLLLLTIGIKAQTFELPYPDTLKIEKQIKETDYQHSSLYYYLLNNFGKVGLKDSVRFLSQTNQYCAYKQYFNHDISLRTHTCEEVGRDERIVFPKIESKALHPLIEAFFKTNDNSWQTDEYYGPKEDGEAGCYINIIQNENSTVLDYYCGC